MLQVRDLRGVIDASTRLVERVEIIQCTDHDKAERQSIAVALQAPSSQRPLGHRQRLMAARHSIHVVSEKFRGHVPRRHRPRVG